MGGTLIPFVSIADDVQNHIFHIEGIGKNEFPAFRQTIMSCCQKRREELEAEKRKERVNINIDFSTLQAYMEKGGLVLQKTKCPECNAPIPIPATGNQIICQHCGSAILAQDVFEKIRSLIQRLNITLGVACAPPRAEPDERANFTPLGELSTGFQIVLTTLQQGK